MINANDMLGTDERPRKNKLQEVIDLITEEYDFRFNQVTNMPEFRNGTKTGAYKPVDDVAINSISLRLRLNGYNELTSVNTINTIINSNLIIQYNPILDYFNNLPNINTSYHIEKLCDSLTLVNEENRVKINKLIKKWLIASCATALGYATNHVCLVLIGEQGRYKTSWLNNLCPAALNEYMYTGHIEPSLTQGETPNLLAEKFIINIDDQLTTIFGRDFNALKSIITAPDVGNRKAYARYSKKRRRIANFCASVNDTNFLTDTENRRYLCIEVEKCDILEPNFIDMVWAEVFAIVKSKKVPLYFTSEENKIINEINANYTEVTLEADLLQKYFSPVKTNDTYVYSKNFTHGELLLYLQQKAGNVRVNGYALTRALKRFGYERKGARDAQTKAVRYGYDCYEFLPDCH